MTSESDQDPDPDILELSSGVVLRLGHPSPILLNYASKAVSREEPKAPQVWVAAKERYEENPNDPEFKQATRAWLADSGIRMLRALIPTGSTLEAKPDGMMGPDDPDFADLMDTLGQELGKGPQSRYTQWVLNVAAEMNDLGVLGERLMRRAGVREEDVREAQALFRGDEERGTDPGTPADGGSDDRDQVLPGGPGSDPGI